MPLSELQREVERRLASGDNGATEAVDLVLEHAVQRKASDVHFEPWDDCLSVRYRIDGMLHDSVRIPKKYQDKVIARIKILAKIAVYHKDQPRDGRIECDATTCAKPMRVSTLPTVYGEKTVVRILDSDDSLYSLNALGFQADTTAALRSTLLRPQGTLLLTGPSSSGKTTSIYALLRELVASRKPAPHMVTIEDPVEYRLGNIAQTEVNAVNGYTFESALRAVLRQDPEVIMLGEIRDPETARSAIQAGLTGHLVISTIHSGTAAGVFTRLLEMGVEPYLVASSVTGVLAQRLVRQVCPQCSEPYEPEAALLEGFGLDGDSNSLFADIPPETGKNIPRRSAPPPSKGDSDNPLLSPFKRGAGCDACQGIGYVGRRAIAEMLTVDECIAEQILNRPRTRVLHDTACAAGMRSLADDGLLHVRAGETTLEELRRVIPPSAREGTSG
ncbi:MAG: type II/IV secretion system protein [bacterium]|nr:type II/IV secretion system protein [bacterium]